MPEAKGCPYCGWVCGGIVKSEGGWAAVCSGCGAKGPVAPTTIAATIFWNVRKGEN